MSCFACRNGCVSVRGKRRCRWSSGALLGLVWVPFAYLARLYMVLFIEPCLHPLKLPACILAGKFVYPLLSVNLPWATTQLSPFLGPWLAWMIVGFHFFVLPDIFGFFFWEIKENWSLYAANRPSTLRPVLIGSHGETMRRLLQPGFHSGTIPTLYDRHRKAEQLALKSGKGSAARASRLELEKVEQSVRKFVDREFINLLKQSQSWRGGRADRPRRVGDQSHHRRPGAGAVSQQGAAGGVRGVPRLAGGGAPRARLAGPDHGGPGPGVEHGAGHSVQAGWRGNGA